MQINLCSNCFCPSVLFVTIRSHIVRRTFSALLCNNLARFYRVAQIDLLKNPELSLKAFVSGADIQWHPRRNGDLKPEDVPYNYGGEVWWKCPNGDDHIWKTVCRSRVDYANRKLEPCPFCSNHRLSKTNSLLTWYPDLAAEFDSSSNNGLLASQVIHTSKRPYHWKCKHNHVYQMTIQQRLQHKTTNTPCCPVCRKISSSSLLFETYPDLFEESYNWLNCHSLPPPQPVEEIYYPEDSFEQIDFGELYVKKDDIQPVKLPISSPKKSQSETIVDESMQKSLRNHLLEYQIWKESIKEDDKRIIWWVCSNNPEHVWRESVRSRIKSECPFCKAEHSQNKQTPNRLIEVGSGKLVPMLRRPTSSIHNSSEEEISYTFYEPYSVCFHYSNNRNKFMLSFIFK